MANSMPPRTSVLIEGRCCRKEHFAAHVVECGWHGWQFDVRNGQCLTLQEKLRTYEVFVEDGWVKVIHRSR